MRGVDMKSPCCGVMAIMLIAIISLQIWTICHLPQAPAPVPTPAPSAVPSTVPSPLATATPQPAIESKLLFERNNIAACSYTDTAPFALREAHTVTKLQTWYSWSSNEASLNYKLKQGDKVMHAGTLVRKDCDPYQRQWCQAVEENLTLSLAAGEYQLVADNRKICQNAGSGGDGFIFVYGR